MMDLDCRCKDEGAMCHECNCAIDLSAADGDWNVEEQYHLCWSCLVDRVGELSILVRRLICECGSEKLRDQASEFLKLKGLHGSILR